MTDPTSKTHKGKEAVLTLIMPVYHEGDAVIPAIATLFYTLRHPFHLIVVHDSAEDETVATVRELQRHFEDITLVRNEWGSGIVNAIKTGFKHADTPYVGIWIAYLVDPFGVINVMIQKLERDYDLVSANRFGSETRHVRGHYLKKALSFWGNVFFRRIIGLPIADATTGIKIFRRSLLDSIPPETDLNGGWAIVTELTIKAAIKGFRLAEVPFEAKNINIIHGTTNFRVFKQLRSYLRWLCLGWQNRKLIRNNSNKE
ncbi:MAG: glycosyltransferase family 2 protein [Nitrospirae bacterium]|nr:glycosyltransferase family 2 protein [Nitrospirota bacterium]